MTSDASFIDEIIQPGDAPDCGVRVRVGNPIPVMMSPEGDARWGLFMFPSLWRLRDSRLVCAVTIGNDEMPSDADYHYLWYVSEDDGERWVHTVPGADEADGWLRQRFTLSSGRQICYRPKMVSVDQIDAEPVDVSVDPFKDVAVFFRLGDLPPSCRSLSFYHREREANEWREDEAAMDPDILVPAFQEAVLDESETRLPTHAVVATRLRSCVLYVGDRREPALGWSKGASKDNDKRNVQPYSIRNTDVPGVSLHNASWGVSRDGLDPSKRPSDVTVRLQIPMPTSLRLHDQHCRPILEDRGGDLVCTSFSSPHPASGHRVVKEGGRIDTESYPNIFKSRDGGRSWHYYASVPFHRIGDFTVSHANMTLNMPSGVWMAMLRTYGKKGTDGNPMMLTRSSDDGLTWSQPVAIRPGSVNPVGGLLQNGVAFRLYGRPGQFITFCGDGEGVRWGNDITLVPAGPGDPRIEQNRNSCCNSCLFALGPDHFIAAYTHYTYQTSSGAQRPAVLVSHITARNEGRYR